MKTLLSFLILSIVLILPDQSISQIPIGPSQIIDSARANVFNRITVSDYNYDGYEDNIIRVKSLSRT